jgi:hypothetical protein
MAIVDALTGRFEGVSTSSTSKTSEPRSARGQMPKQRGGNNGGNGGGVNDDLTPATLCTCNRLEFQESVEDLKRMVSTQDKLIDCQFQILKAFSDLYLELTDRAEERKFIQKTLTRLEREAAVLRLPLWFWRPEPEIEFKRQLLRRARYLIAEKVSVDDTWDLMKEFARDWAHQDLSDATLKKCLEYAKENPDGSAP